MCSVGSSNVNILHPPSYSPVPGPGIPLPSNGRLVPTLSFFLSCLLACLLPTKTHRITLFLSPHNYFESSNSFPFLLATYISSFPFLQPFHLSLISLPFLFLSFFFFWNNPSISFASPPTPQLLSHWGLFAW